jgi:hypothetical protein
LLPSRCLTTQPLSLSLFSSFPSLPLFLFPHKAKVQCSNQFLAKYVKCINSLQNKYTVSTPCKICAMYMHARTHADTCHACWGAHTREKSTLQL